MGIDDSYNTNFPNSVVLYNIVRLNNDDTLINYFTIFNNQKNFTQDQKIRLKSNINNMDVSYYNPTEILNLRQKIENFNRDLNTKYSNNWVLERINNFKYNYSQYEFYKYYISVLSGWYHSWRGQGYHRNVCSSYRWNERCNIWGYNCDYDHGNSSGNSSAYDNNTKVYIDSYGKSSTYGKLFTEKSGINFCSSNYKYKSARGLSGNAYNEWKNFEKILKDGKWEDRRITYYNELKNYFNNCLDHLRNLQKMNVLLTIKKGPPIYRGITKHKFNFSTEFIIKSDKVLTINGKKFIYTEIPYTLYYMPLSNFKIDKQNDKNYLYKIDYGDAYNSSSYICPSTDGETCMVYKEKYKTSGGKIPITSASNIYAITCNTPGKMQTINEKEINPSNLCKMKYDYYNLYKTKNPYLVKGRNLSQDFPNQIDNSTQLAEITSDYDKIFKNTANTDQGRKDAINAKLTDAPLKLACCNINNNTKEFKYDFKVPLNPNNNDISRDLKIKKYENEKITIPEGSCKVLTDQGYEKYSDQCNLFMKLYCDNMVIEYNKLNLNEITFADYCPECACYAPRTELETNIPDGISPKCYKNDCIDNSISYLDPISQVNTCQTTICNNIVNASDIAAGGDAKFNLRLSNECGAQIAAAKDSFNQKKVESDRLEKIDRLIESASLEDRNEYYETVNKQINFNDDKINKLLKLQLKLKSKIEELENSKIQSDEIQQQIINDKIQTEELQKEIDNIEIKNDKLENDKLEQQKIEQQELEQQELDKLNLEKQKIEQENLNEENLNEENLNEENLSYKNNNMAITEEETSTYTIIYIICGIVCCIILIIIIFYFMSSGRRKRMGRGRGMGR